MKSAASPVKAVVLIGLGSALAACASQPTTRLVSEAESAPLPPTQVYFYPLHDQTAKQQDRDRYQCYLWAKKQTGFDPSAPVPLAGKGGRAS